MYTQCPHCLEIYRISPKQLSLSRGQCTCPNCGHRFNALDRLSDEPHAAPFEAPTPLKDPLRLIPMHGNHQDMGRTSALSVDAPDMPDDDPPLGSLDWDIDDPADISFSSRTAREPRIHLPALTQTPAPTPAPLANLQAAADRLDAHEDDDDEVMPAFARSHHPHTARTRQWPWWLGTLALLLSLGVLLLAHKFQTLAADPKWRPQLAQMCDWVGCTLPLWHEPESLNLTYSNLGKSERNPKALRIEVNFRNESPFAQTWPQLEVTLTDFDGTPVALRRFSVHQYLGRSPQRALASGQSVNVDLLVQDPGIDGVAYNIALK